MKKQTIVLASVLKPVDDTRMLEKMAYSLANEYTEVFIIGQPTSKTPALPPNIQFLTLSKFHRLSIKRLLAPLQVALFIYQVKPNMLIVNTHDLLFVSIANRILFGTKIIYDIRENYFLNILHTNGFPKWLRPFLSCWVRGKELLTSPLFHHYFLAEKGYEKELNFIRKKFTVLENKVKIPVGYYREPIGEKNRLLFSGTLAESTGLFEAIELAKKLHDQTPQIELLIIGYCAIPRELTRILTSLKNYPFITLIGGDKLVPHHQILDAISKAHYGIISYPPSIHIENSIPTKLYEYLGCQLPILLQNHPPWMSLCETYAAAISFDYKFYDAKDILQQMMSRKFYTQSPVDVTWESEEKKLHSTMHTLFRGK